MNMIITGGAGFIGSHLVDYSINNFNRVVVLDNFSTGLQSNLNEKACNLEVDVSTNYICHNDFNRWLYSNNFSPNIIFHLAAVSRIQPSFQNVDLMKNDLISTIHALELAKKYHSKIIYVSSCSASVNAEVSPYGFYKKIGEQYCIFYHKTYGVPVNVVRLFNVYGPRHNLKDDLYKTVVASFEENFINKKPFIIYGNGSKKRDFIHVDDVVKALYDLSKQTRWNADIFDVGSGQTYSISEVAAMFGDVEIKYLPDRPGELKSISSDIVPISKIC